MTIGPSVLLVDDVPASQESSAALLTREGDEVSRAADVEEALRALSERRPAAILSQIQESANGAIDIVRRLALHTHAPSVPVVVLIAPHEFQKGRSLGGAPGVRRIPFSPGPPEAVRIAVSPAVRHSNAE